MTISPGTAASADEVMNAMGILFKNTSQALLNAEIIGINTALDKEYKNVKLDTLQSATYLDTTNGDIAYTAGDFAYGTSDVWGSIAFPDDYTVDEADTASHAGTITTAKDSVLMSGSFSGTDNSVNPLARNDSIDLRNGDAASTVTLKVAGSAASMTANLIIQLYDGSTAVTLVTKSVSTSFSKQLLRFDIDPAGDNVAVYNNSDINSESSVSNVDITSLSGAAAWRLRFSITVSSTNGGDSYSFQIRPLRYLLSSAGTADFVSTATTASETITNAILCVNTGNTAGGDDVGTATYYLSADNGSNYEEVTPNQIHRFTNTGTQLIVKIEMVTDPADFYILNQYSAIYNLY